MHFEWSAGLIVCIVESRELLYGQRASEGPTPTLTDAIDSQKAKRNAHQQ